MTAFYRSRVVVAASGYFVMLLLFSSKLSFFLSFFVLKPRLEVAKK